MIISYSELFKWDTCHRQYYYRFGLGLKPEEESEPIRVGVTGHKLLQTFYAALQNGLSKDRAITYMRHEAQKIMQSVPFGEVTLLKALIVVEKYILETEFTSEAVLVENRFLFPAAKLSDDPSVADVQIGFTPDVVFERTGGFVDVEDSKFVERAWSKSKLDHFIQAKLYQIFLQEMGYNVTRTSIRFFNTKTNEIEVKNFELKSGERETIIEDFIAGVKEVIAYRSLSKEEMAKARRTSNNNMCQGCSFSFPCMLEGQGKDASKTLHHLYVKSDYNYAN